MYIPLYQNVTLFTSHYPGYVCEEHENPADYFLDVINHCQKKNSQAEVSGI